MGTMPGVTWWITVGAVLELVGLALAAVGFRQTWLEHAGDEPFLRPVTRRVSAWTMAARRRVRVWLRRPEHRTVASAEVALGWDAAEARGVVSWGPLPDPVANLAAFASNVDDRLNRLHTLVQEARHAVADEQMARADADGKLRDEFSGEVGRVEFLSHRVAVGGLRLQALGWFFVLLGVVVSTVGNLVQASSST
jgi:hypothetical protein